MTNHRDEPHKILAAPDTQDPCGSGEGEPQAQTSPNWGQSDSSWLSWFGNGWPHSGARLALWNPPETEAYVRWARQVCGNHLRRFLFLLLKLTKKLSCLPKTPSRRGKSTQPRHTGNKGPRKIKPIPDGVSSRFIIQSAGHSAEVMDVDVRDKLSTPATLLSWTAPTVRDLRGCIFIQKLLTMPGGTSLTFLGVRNRIRK